MIENVALVALPWSHVARPAAALGALGAYVRRELPSIGVSCFYNYVDVARAVGPRLYDHFARHCYELGEMVYLPLTYPERRPHVVSYVAGKLGDRLEGSSPAELSEAATSWSDVVERTVTALDAQIQSLAGELAGRYDVVGLTTCFGQLFANVALARAIKARAPETVVVLGGSSVSARVGPALMEEYACIDYVIQGEGERPVVELLRRLEVDRSRADFEHAILSRSNARHFPRGAPLLEVTRLDDLPIPDFDEYARVAKRHGIAWDLPIEGSRGCWWDRVKRTGDAKDTCYFCNLNVQWNGYRQKSEERVVEEVRELGDRYANGRIFFLDNIIRHRGLERLAEGLASLDRDLELFYEMRSNVRPAQMVALWEAGLRQVQVGIEGLSSSLLKRIGKGTTTIQNLEAMKTCFELGVQNNSNLIVDFPTSTPEEVEETVRAIEHYALPYEPLHITTFELGIGSTTEVLAERFQLSAIRNADLYLNGMPNKTWARLPMLSNLSFAQDGPVADWSPVLRACDAWRKRHDEVGADRFLLSYEDGATYLRIRDRRERFKDHILRGSDRLLYLYCSEIRGIEQVLSRFGTERSHRLIEDLVARRLMFREGDRLLSLATARSPRAAVRRIHALENVRASASRRTSPAGHRHLGDSEGRTGDRRAQS